MSSDSKGEELGVGCGDVEVFKVTLTTVSELCHSLDHFVTKQFVSKSREPNLMKKVLSRKNYSEKVSNRFYCKYSTIVKMSGQNLETRVPHALGDHDTTYTQRFQ